MYDCIVIGAGPAGMTAGIYLARKKIKTLILSQNLGGQMIWSSSVENYSGFSAISGFDLTQKFQEHLLSLKDSLQIITGPTVSALEKNFTSFQIDTLSGDHYFAKSVIIASGKEPRHLGVPGEDKFYGKGVSTCATCDAPLYKDRIVAVIGGGNSALDALLTLSRFAKTVHSLNINSELKGEEVLKTKVESTPNIIFHSHAKILEIQGTSQVEAVSFQKSSGSIQRLEVTGVFIEIGYQANAFFDRLTHKNPQGEIKVNSDLATNIPGLFAAGDINDSKGDQIIIASGEGAKAALSAACYLNSLKG